MSIKEFTKSGTVALVLLVLVVVGVPLALAWIGDETGFFEFPATKWVKGLFSSSDSRAPTFSDEKSVDWNEQLEELKRFSEWADGRDAVKISIVRPEVFQIERADPNPATASHFSWKLKPLSGTLNMNATQVRKKLALICEPKDKVSGVVAMVEPLGGGEQGFRVTVDNVRGEGKIGLSYDGLPPVYYDVKLRRMWLVPVASCRSAMKDRYESAVFFPGMEKGLTEGSVISPSNDKCGYRVLSISDHCVWFEAFYGNKPDKAPLPHNIWPDFSRVDTMPPTPLPGRLMFGRNRCFWPNDAIKLPTSGTYLLVDDFLAGRAVVFRLLNSKLTPVRDLLCVIVREK